jgi:hypothetical protein
MRSHATSVTPTVGGRDPFVEIVSRLPADEFQLTPSDVVNWPGSSVRSGGATLRAAARGIGVGLDG